MAGEIFPCKAFVYSSAKEECHLSAESGLKKGREAFELSPISNGEYHEKICLTCYFLNYYFFILIIIFVSFFSKKCFWNELFFQVVVIFHFI